MLIRRKSTGAIWDIEPGSVAHSRIMETPGEYEEVSEPIGAEPIGDSKPKGEEPEKEKEKKSKKE